MSTRISRKPPGPTRGAELDFYESLLPVQKAVHMSVQFGSFMFVLGDERLNALEGVERLAAVSRAPHLFEPQNALESLIMGFKKPWRLVDVLKPYEPELGPDDWTRIAANDWMLPSDPKLPSLSPAAQLLLYRVGAWRDHFVFVGRPIEEKLVVWDSIPEAVRRDPLMQQIVALKSSDLFEVLVARDPNWGWDSFAHALFLQKSGPPSAKWIQRLPEEIVRMVFPYNKHNNQINAMNAELLHFADSQLPLIQELNPALFIQGLIFDRDRREEPQAALWFDRMWAGVLKKTAKDPSYAALIISKKSMVDDGLHVEKVFNMFAPDAVSTIGISLALEDSPALAWTHWLVAQANASQADYAMALPDLDAPGP